ncbi:phage NrS-1 polymerase family protein, partial [Haloferax profundi]
TGDVDDDAQDIIDRLDSYTEVSPSGTGYHVLIKGELPNGRNRRGHIELYDTARFFTVTGDRVDNTPGQVKRRQDALEAIHREYVQLHSENKDPERDEHTSVRDDANTTPAVSLEDNELLKKAKNASNGPKFERLWNGNTAGYDSNSEADMALCCLLAFWTGGDTTQMDTLFRQSGLLRAKWDEVHYADGSTYGEKTIERATEATSEYYDPSPRNESTQSKLETEPESTDVDTDEPNRQNAYLIEKNQLLSTRVSELEATIEQKDERIEELESQVEGLSADLSARSDANND